MPSLYWRYGRSLFRRNTMLYLLRGMHFIWWHCLRLSWCSSSNITAEMRPVIYSWCCSFVQERSGEKGCAQNVSLGLTAALRRHIHSFPVPAACVLQVKARLIAIPAHGISYDGITCYSGPVPTPTRAPTRALIIRPQRIVAPMLYSD
jgi:hypothetical protein